MLLVQILGGIFGLAIVWIPVHFFEQRSKKRLQQELEELRIVYKLGAKTK